MRVFWTIKNVTVLSLMIATIICLLSGCSKAQQISANNKPLPCFQTVRELCPQSTVLEGFVIRGGLERDGQYLVIKGARAEEAQKEVESWLALPQKSLPSIFEVFSASLRPLR
jgi:hypothetical protein